jgi:hypothetical protein
MLKSVVILSECREPWVVLPTNMSQTTLRVQAVKYVTDPSNTEKQNLIQSVICKQFETLKLTLLQEVTTIELLQTQPSNTYGMLVEQPGEIQLALVEAVAGWTGTYTQVVKLGRYYLVDTQSDTKLDFLMAENRALAQVKRTEEEACNRLRTNCVELKQKLSAATEESRFLREVNILLNGEISELKDKLKEQKEQPVQLTQQRALSLPIAKKPSSLDIAEIGKQKATIISQIVGFDHSKLRKSNIM